jgi:hypothetical protein
MRNHKVFFGFSAICWLVIGFAELPRFSYAETSETLVEPEIRRTDRDHWAYRPIQRSAVSKLASDDRSRNPIDRFILKTINERQLIPQGQADRVTLIRRLSFGIRGLPPTAAEIEQFVSSPAPDAYQQLADRMLSSFHYGEHWGQHWLDLARFADTDGFEFDKERADAWKYRDWVIQALNDDMPYDRFVAFQLAGDELEPVNERARVATVFCLSGPDMPDINSQEQRRQNVLNELTGTVGSVLLGLQIGCAQCHDHKFDPISQADFYRLRAVFERAVHVTRNKSLNVLQEKEGQLTKSYLMIRGDWRRQGPEIQPGFPRIANPGNLPFTVDSSIKTSGRRTALADWITHPENPLTARVIVNRLWQYHFGTGLVPSTSDFGIGHSPSHPELLDWLALELIQNAWSLKHIHRVIVNSATYRQKSLAHGEVPQDPENTWLSYFSRRRLSGEAIRDAMLAASGSLSKELGGKGVHPPLPEALKATLIEGQWHVSERLADHYRRSIYLFARRNLPYPIFEAFDRPDGNASCARRLHSTTAPQSLLMLNSTLSLDAAQRLAGRLLSDHVTIGEQMFEDLLIKTFGRTPTEKEKGTLRQFHQNQTRFLLSDERGDRGLALPIPLPAGVDHHAAAALTDICLAVFNATEFMYVD